MDCELVDKGTYGPKMDGRSEGGGMHLDLNFEGVPTPGERDLGLRS